MSIIHIVYTAQIAAYENYVAYSLFYVKMYK